MEQKHNITDEQIASFIGGTATKEENDAILEYMSQSDENVDELMAIADAVQAQRNSDQAVKRSNNRTFAWRVAASVAVILIAGGVWLLLRDHGVAVEPQAGNTVALNTTPTPTPVTLSTVPADDNQEHSNNQVSNNTSTVVDDAEQEGDLSQYQSEDIQRNPRPHQLTSSSAGSFVASLSTGTTNHSTSRPETERILRPDVPKQWTSGFNLVIAWTTNAPKVVVRIKPLGSKKWIVDRVIDNSNVDTKDWVTSLTIPASERYRYCLDADKLQWRLEAIFDDDKKEPQPCTGIISLSK